MPLSLRKRLFVSAIIVLICFLGVAGIALDRAYRDSVLISQRETLVSYLYALLAATDVSEIGLLSVSSNLLDQRYSVPGSGFYAAIVSPNMDQPLWQSLSLLSVDLPSIPSLDTGVMNFSKQKNPAGEEFFVINFGVAWQVANDFNRYIFTVAEDLSRYQSEVSVYRKTLWFWLSGLALLLLVVQGLVLQWGLLPLRKVADEIRAIEAGEQDSLAGLYPKELSNLTNNINNLIRNERNHLLRYRHTLADLAHSLKTPLSVLQGYFEDKQLDRNLCKVTSDQVWRMQEIVDYQLQRAAVSGKQTFSKSIEVKPIANQLITTLDKVYRDKHIVTKMDIENQVMFHGEKGDLMEVLGNLLENAYKWANSQVNLSIYRVQFAASQQAEVVINVDDDGPGISQEIIDRITLRGVRGDENNGPPGQGIGLSVVSEIVKSYSGDLAFDNSELGGCRVSASFPV